MDFDHRLALEHTIAAGQLPGPHRDPWNRVAVARACGTASRALMLDPVFANGVPADWRAEQPGRARQRCLVPMRNHAQFRDEVPASREAAVAELDG
jgi:hypothetical protein